MSKCVTALFVLNLMSSVCFGSDRDAKAHAFISIYSDTCLRNFTKLENLRKVLYLIPKFPTEQAALFLAGHPGDAWPVPMMHGTFVIALPTDMPVCMTYARQANTEIVLEQFIRIVENPLAPITSTKLKDDSKPTNANGLTRTISYEWSIPNHSLNVLYTLSIAPSENAQLQVLGSVALIKR